MSMHDNFLDVMNAWEAYDKAYVRWGKAVDGKEPKFKPAPEAKQIEAALAMADALRDLENAAREALKDMKGYGWPTKRDADGKPEPAKARRFV